MSLTITTPKALRSAWSARMKARPMRPNPLMPMRTLAMFFLGAEMWRGWYARPGGPSITSRCAGAGRGRLLVGAGGGPRLPGVVALGLQLLEDRLGEDPERLLLLGATGTRYDLADVGCIQG